LVKSFENREDGAEPFAGVVLSGETLYGATVAGTIFRVNTDGSSFTVLKRLAWPEGAFPEADLVLSGSTLYGTTLAGGDWGYGTVFKLNTDGSGFTVLKSFTGDDGRGPRAGLTLSGSALYGTTADTYEGGSTNWGTVFMLSTDGTGFQVLKYFTGSEGAHPSCNLVLSDSTLYGTTTSGGPLGGGVVFSLSLPPPTITTPPLSQTAEAGATVGLDVCAEGGPALSYQWFFNETNALSDATTNAWLELADAQSPQSGSYIVVVTDVFGAATSSPAILSVIPPVDRRLVPGISLNGETGSVLALESTEVLAPEPFWVPLANVLLEDESEFYFDLSAPLPPQRFFRAWQPGVPSVLPVLSIHLIPALTLTGEIGNTIRVDGINQIGPTDAWFTLDTVTLTNTSQLYFDVSIIGQPPRLYRLVPAP
jgi:uncharacterized repeat protein (TIGR03803 family)